MEISCWVSGSSDGIIGDGACFSNQADSLEGRLVVVFEHFNEIYRSISARLKAEQLRVRKKDHG